jgi:hypothetical protein
MSRHYSSSNIGFSRGGARLSESRVVHSAAQALRKVVAAEKQAEAPVRPRTK